MEVEWQTIDAHYSYSDWEKKRQEDWQRIISQRLPELGRSIDVDSGLFTHMQSRAVFDRRTIETFKQEAGTYAQVSSVLHALNKLSFSGFVGFCECLLKTGQAAVVVDFLTPELHERQQQQQQQQPLLNVDVRHHGAGEGAAASLALLGVVDLRPADEPPPPALASPLRVVDYDWKSLIRENLVQLTQHVDPDSGLLNELLSRGVISYVSADVIKSKKGRVNRVGAILDHVTQFRPDSDFVKLCEALEATDQHHVVRRYLTCRDAAADPAQHAAVWTGGRPADTAAATTTYSRPGQVVDTWRTALVENRSAIIELLEASDEFVNRLVAYGVMNFATGELCREDSDVMARSELILDHMQRRASLDMAFFCQALDDTGQRHIVHEFFQRRRPTDDVSDAAQVSVDSDEAAGTTRS